MQKSATIVLDIGKTNVKLALLDADGKVLAEKRRANAMLQDGPYPHHDVDGIWHWMLAGCRDYAAQATVGAIVPVTHGATAALVDEHGLVLPVPDYEAQFEVPDYASLRDDYAQTLSPALPAGLNLGRQLVWLARQHARDFHRARHILMYPQYWAWRLSGVAASEVTSLGCHTDLWLPRSQTWAPLVERMQWQALMPAIAAPWQPLGALLPEVAAASGLPPSCKVLCGIHDSNASLLRYLDADGAAGHKTVLSTGTWMIAAAFGAPLEGLRENADMLANSNAIGQPVACMRFMGGREFSLLAGATPEPCGIAEIEKLITAGSFALPNFAESGGPFPARRGEMVGAPAANAKERYALATLYCVLMTHYCLDALGAAGQIVVEGSFSANPHFAALLAALRPQQTVSVSDDASGTTAGGWMLHHWGELPAASGRRAAAFNPAGWLDYAARWRAQLA